MYSSFTSSFDAFVFTKTAASAILGGCCARLEVWANCIFSINVLAGGKKLVRFISKKRFLQYFAECRKQRSNGIRVVQNAFNPRLFSARSARDENKIYSLVVHTRFISCDCEDFKNQCQLFGEDKLKACKHVYSVLNFMGYGSLRDYISRTWDYRFRN